MCEYTEQELFPSVDGYPDWDDLLRSSGFGGSAHWMLVIIEAGSLAGNNRNFEKLKRSIKYKSHTL